jgi:hypothetical protein
MSDTPGRGQTAERAMACGDADRYGRGTAESCGPGGNLIIPLAERDGASGGP